MTFMQDSLKVRHLAHNQENVGATPTPALNVDIRNTLIFSALEKKESVKSLTNGRGCQQGVKVEQEVFLQSST